MSERWQSGLETQKTFRWRKALATEGSTFLKEGKVQEDTGKRHQEKRRRAETGRKRRRGTVEGFETAGQTLFFCMLGQTQNKINNCWASGWQLTQFSIYSEPEWRVTCDLLASSPSWNWFFDTLMFVFKALHGRAHLCLRLKLYVSKTGLWLDWTSQLLLEVLRSRCRCWGDVGLFPTLITDLGLFKSKLKTYFSRMAFKTTLCSDILLFRYLLCDFAACSLFLSNFINIWRTT